MGNRAVVTVKGSSVGIYLHWNGGIESVTAFLRAAKDLGVRDPVNDPAYFYARFVQLVGNFFFFWRLRISRRRVVERT